MQSPKSSTIRETKSSPLPRHKRPEVGVAGQMPTLGYLEIAAILHLQESGGGSHDSHAGNAKL